MKPPPLGQVLPDLMETLERVQYRAGLAVTGAWQSTNRVKIYEELGWKSLSSYRRISSRLGNGHLIPVTPGLHFELTPKKSVTP